MRLFREFLQRLLFAATVCLWLGSILSEAAISPCLNESDLVYDRYGEISIAKSITQCINNVDDALLFPGAQLKAGVLYNVSAQVTLNNLIVIDELTNTVEIDMLLRLRWVDKRLNLPALWPKFKNQNYKTLGFPIDTLVSSGLVQIWLPDVFFPDSIGTETTDSNLRIYSDGLIGWTRAMKITLIQSGFDYHLYPRDTQKVVMRFNSFSMSTRYLRMVYDDPPSILYQSYSGKAAVDTNPIWSFKGIDTSLSIEDNGPKNAPKLRWVCRVTLTIQRAPAGLVLRLGYPVCLLVLLASLTFWASKDQKIPNTITLLLAVSALYIVVFANIPMLGYMTEFDLYMQVSFSLIFACLIIHSWTTRETQEENPRPLSVFLNDMFNSIGRAFLPPAAVFIFFFFFSRAYSEGFVTVCYVLILAFSAIVGIAEWIRLREDFLLLLEQIRKSIVEIKRKGETTTSEAALLRREIFFANFFLYNKISLSLDHVEIAADPDSGEKNTDTIDSLLQDLKVINEEGKRKETDNNAENQYIELAQEGGESQQQTDKMGQANSAQGQPVDASNPSPLASWLNVANMFPVTK